MVALRATKKLLSRLPAVSEIGAQSDTALGDWFANRIVVDRHPLLLLVSSRSLLALLTPARDVRSFPVRLAALVRRRLRHLGIADDLIGPEVAAMTPVLVGSTNDRSVLGTLVDFARAVPYYLPRGRWDETTLPFVEGRLGETPCRVTGRFEDTIFPHETAARLLAERWGKP